MDTLVVTIEDDTQSMKLGEDWSKEEDEEARGNSHALKLIDLRNRHLL